MKENTYRITYKNGNSITTKAYSMELKNGKIYQCCKALIGDQGVPSIIDGSKISSVDLVEEGAE